MSIADKLTLIANTKEALRVKLDLGVDVPFSEYAGYIKQQNDITKLFINGEQGVWYDPSDKSTLFQDVAGTVPVTKDGDPVALMRDKSGNGNHAKQTVSASRPVYKTDGFLHWLAFDGIDDSFENIGTYGLKNQTFAIAYEQKSQNQILLKPVGFDGQYRYFAGEFNGVDTGAGVSVTSLHVDSSAVAVPASANAIYNRVMGKHVQYWVTNSTAKYVATWSLGGYAGNMLFGDMYGLIFINTDVITVGQRLQIEQYLASKSGITI